jgi:hypothetical protein
MTTYQPIDLSDPIMAVGDPADAKTLRWLALGTSTDETRPTLTGLCVRNGITASTDGFRLHVAPTPATLEALQGEIVRPQAGKWPAAASKAVSYAVPVVTLVGYNYPNYEAIVKDVQSYPVAGTIRLAGKYLREFAEGLSDDDHVEIVVFANKNGQPGNKPALLRTVPRSYYAGKSTVTTPARYALVMPISRGKKEDAAYDPFPGLWPQPETEQPAE